MRIKARKKASLIVNIMNKVMRAREDAHYFFVGRN